MEGTGNPVFCRAVHAIGIEGERRRKEETEYEDVKWDQEKAR